MDAAFLSHVVLWVIGGLSVLGLIGSTAAMFAMGRQGSYKN